MIEKLYKYFPLEAGRSPKLQQLFPCLPTRIKYIRCFFENSIKRVFFIILMKTIQLFFIIKILNKMNVKYFGNIKF